MIKGNIKKHHGVGYVCYLDILGFSFDILNNWNNPKEDPLKTILEIKSNLKVIPSGNNSGFSNDKGSYQYVPRIKSISDSIIISFGLDESRMFGDMLLGLETIVANVNSIWSFLIKKGYTIRGAIDFGNIYWDEDEIIGPAFINAYQLESNLARISRVVISSKLNEVIKDLSTHFKGDLGQHLIDNFRKDIDGYTICNPTKLSNNEEERIELINQLKSLKDKAEGALIKEKYTSLIYTLEVNEKQKMKIEDFSRY
ncbi:MAG: hypothetical protein ACIAQZ_00505 [Sedimentisphaeraceae bacterium JB056]